MKHGEKKLQPIRLLQKAKDLQVVHSQAFNKLPRVGDSKAGRLDPKAEEHSSKLDKEKKQEAGSFTSEVTAQSVCESLLSR